MIRYVIITPVRDESQYIRKTIRSVLDQEIRPTEWIIVNDGSSDNTGEIINEYSSKYNWIKAIHRQNRGYRKAGSGVIEAFYDGYYNINTKHEWEYLVKLDGDLLFQNDYFKKCFEYFIIDSKLGIGGGEIYNLINNESVLEKTPKFHVRGATKIYRRETWFDIGGLHQVPYWDSLDEIKANMLGWKTYSFSDLKIVHLRVTGGSDGVWRDSVKGGVGSYISGYHPLFMLLRCFYRSLQRPYLVKGFGLFYGYTSSYFKKLSKIDDPKLISYLRRQQVKKLLFQKSIWN